MLTLALSDVYPLIARAIASQAPQVQEEILKQLPATVTL